MGFWWWMLTVAILCPTVMIIAGLYFKKSAPKKINAFFGYRTTMSMKNRDTWEFAHRYIGSLWSILGFALIIPSAVPMLLVIGGSEALIGVTSLIIAFFGLIALLVPVILTERALKKTFDKNEIL